MALLMSGKCTSRYISAVYVVCFYIEVACREKVKLPGDLIFMFSFEVPLVGVMEYLKYIIKEDKENIT